MNINQTLKHYFGYDSLRKGQSELIEGILRERCAWHHADRSGKVTVLPASGAYA